MLGDQFSVHFQLDRIGVRERPDVHLVTGLPVPVREGMHMVGWRGFLVEVWEPRSVPVSAILPEAGKVHDTEVRVDVWPCVRGGLTAVVPTSPSPSTGDERPSENAFGVAAAETKRQGTNRRD